MNIFARPGRVAAVVACVCAAAALSGCAWHGSHGASFTCCMDTDREKINLKAASIVAGFATATVQAIEQMESFLTVAAVTIPAEVGSVFTIPAKAVDNVTTQTR